MHTGAHATSNTSIRKPGPGGVERTPKIPLGSNTPAGTQSVPGCLSFQRAIVEGATDVSPTRQSAMLPSLRPTAYTVQ